MSKLDFLIAIKDDITNILRGKSEINPDVFLNPARYSIRLPIEKIVADSKISRSGIDLYKRKIQNHEKIAPIVVVKHPRKDLYAVLDGHHRYYAYRELGRKQLTCALAGDYSSVVFYLTKNGYFQPSPEITEGIRTPVIRLHHDLKQFLSNFASGKA